MVPLETAIPSASGVEAEEDQPCPSEIDEPQRWRVGIRPGLALREEINVLSVEQLVLQGASEANDWEVKEVEEKRHPRVTK